MFDKSGENLHTNADNNEVVAGRREVVVRSVEAVEYLRLVHFPGDEERSPITVSSNVTDIREKYSAGVEDIQRGWANMTSPNPDQIDEARQRVRDAA